LAFKSFQHTWDLFLSTSLWVLVGEDILRDNAALIQKAETGTIGTVGKAEVEGRSRNS